MVYKCWNHLTSVLETEQKQHIDDELKWLGQKKATSNSIVKHNHPPFVLPSQATSPSPCRAREPLQDGIVNLLAASATEKPSGKTKASEMEAMVHWESSRDGGVGVGQRFVMWRENGDGLVLVECLFLFSGFKRFCCSVVGLRLVLWLRPCECVWWVSIFFRPRCWCWHNKPSWLERIPRRPGTEAVKRQLLAKLPSWGFFWVSLVFQAKMVRASSFGWVSWSDRRPRGTPPSSLIWSRRPGWWATDGVFDGS